MSGSTPHLRPSGFAGFLGARRLTYREVSVER